ncbi:MAG: N-acetylmannosamine-6-phosphate 2-epimerase [Clostridia bacterium]|nr:N-acetylmannosamine-6-phosphate 2-epimerase [Clostridia bacterium]
MGVMNKEQFYDQVRGKLIVSCQALPEEPLHSSFIMGRMACAAFRGGAAGIRANTVEDIAEIRKNVDLPVIGIIKKVYDDYPDVYITPTMAEVDALAACGVEALAMDATRRVRPGGRSLKDFFAEARSKYPEQVFMADCSSVEEGMAAAEMGFDLIGTTMVSYTPYTRGASLPPFDVIEALVKNCGKPVVAEGNLWTPDQLRRAMDLGILTAVVGSAITRPMEITKRFVAALA